MTAKEYLMRYRNLDAKIDTKLERIMRLRALAEKRTAVYNDMPCGGQSDREDIYAKIIDEESDLDREIDRLLLLQAEIEMAIDSVPNDTHRTLLEMRYLTRMTWEQIAEGLYYTRAWVDTLHGRALGQVQIPEKELAEIYTPSVV